MIQVNVNCRFITREEENINSENTDSEGTK